MVEAGADEDGEVDGELPDGGEAVLRAPGQQVALGQPHCRHTGPSRGGIKKLLFTDMFAKEGGRTLVRKRRQTQSLR